MSKRYSSKRVAVLVGMAALAALVPASSASAAGGDCTATLQKKAVSFQPDVYRAAALCRSLQANSKARGVMDAPFEVDQRSQYFTALYVTYYSPYGTSTQGAPTARMEIVPV